MTTILIISLALNIVLAAAVKTLGTTHFGTLSPVFTHAYLHLLSALRIPCSVIVYDIRKMHELNAVFGYSNNNRDLIPRLTKVRRSRGDLVGQYGGDEFVVIATAHAGKTIARRIIARAKEITQSMTLAQRLELSTRTAGIVDGLHIALACEDYTRDALKTAAALVDETERLKESGARQTGNRATTGNIGTLISGL